MKELDLKLYLEKYKNKKVDFYRFPGNYGDSLIWHGTMKLFSDLNINVNAVDVSFPVYNETLIIDGGGNFNDYYSDVRNFLIKKGDLYNEIIILPHTIFGKKQIETLNNLKAKTTVFCREKISADFVSKNTKKVDIYLWHDCAFYNDFESKDSGEGVLNVFRTDRESLIKKIPEYNNDVSYAGYAQKPLEELIFNLDKYKEINTDRLHIAIASTLLGKKVKLHSNSYFKNEAVYEYSLKKYLNIEFIKETSDLSYIITSSLIFKLFNTFLANENEEIFYERNFSSLVNNLIKTNKAIWDLEDNARMYDLGSEHVANAKKEIDKNNQIRNNLINEIDKDITGNLNIEPNYDIKFYSESPGMIIDRLSIIFIKRFEIQKILKIVEDSDLKKKYSIKENIVSNQIDTLKEFLDTYFIELENKEVYFQIQDAVKIYNDSRIRDYIKKIREK